MSKKLLLSRRKNLSNPDLSKFADLYEDLRSVSSSKTNKFSPRVTRSKTKSTSDSAGKSCFICGSLKKAGDRKLCQFTSDERAKTCFEASRCFLDEVFTRTVNFTNYKNLIDFSLYHENCLRIYERKYERHISSCASLNDDGKVHEDPDNFDVSHVDATSNDDSIATKRRAIISVVRSLIPRFEKGEVFDLSELAVLVNKSLPEINLARNQDIKNCLCQHFNDTLTFSTSAERNKPTLIYHKSIKISDLVDRIHSLNVLKESAKVIRHDLMDIDYDLENKFCDASDLESAWNEQHEIPDSLLTFLAELLNFKKKDYIHGIQNDNVEDSSLKEKDKTSSVSPALKIKLNSLCQTIIFIMHGGKQKTPLQVMTGLSVHTTTKSKKLIENLSHQGLSTSYDQIQRIRMSLALLTVELSDKTIPLPTHFDACEYTTGAFDNFDYNESVEIGSFGTHDTVAVLFQDEPPISIKKPNVSDTAVNNKRRTFNENLECQLLKDFEKPNGDIVLPENYSVDAALPIKPDIYSGIRRDDLAWFLTRLNLSEVPDKVLESDEDQTIPSWLAFLSVLNQDSRRKQITGFLPILPHPVTEYSTVYTALHNFVNTLAQLNQTKLAVFCDEGVYRIARHIIFLRGEEFKDIVLMLGSFHMIKIALGCVGKYIRGSGLENVFIDTEMYGVGTVEQVLDGTHYAKSVKEFMLPEEALQRLQLEAFLKETNIEDYREELDLLLDLKTAFKEEEFSESQVLFNSFVNLKNGQLQSEFEKFIASRCNTSTMFQFYNNILLLIRIVRDLIRADRSGDWLLHVETVKKLLPIFNVMDKTNYSRWGAVYYNDIVMLQHTAPEAYDKFMEGRFTVKERNIPFTSKGTNQALEQTINKSSKNTGAGIIGMTRKKKSVAAWSLTYHEMISISNLFKKVTQVRTDNDEYEFHHELSDSFTLQSKTYVIKMINYLKNRVNPFSNNEQVLKNILTNEMASPEVTEALLQVFQTGCTLFNDFQSKRFCDVKKISLSAKIKRVNLPTMELSNTVTKDKPQKRSKKNISYQRMIEIARERNYDIKTLLSYELRDVNPLFDSDGLVKLKKIKLLMRY